MALGSLLWVTLLYAGHWSSGSGAAFSHQLLCGSFLVIHARKEDLSKEKILRNASVREVGFLVSAYIPVYVNTTMQTAKLKFLGLYSHASNIQKYL